MRALWLLPLLASGALAVPPVPSALASSTSSPGGATVAVYGQQWYPWGPEHLGTSTSTIAAEGCALTASTMLLQAYGVSANPGALNQWLINNGGYVDQDLLVWSAVAEYAKSKGVLLSYSGWYSDSLSSIDSALAAGHPVIAQVTLDGGMHFVLLTGLGPNGTIWMNDPWFGDHTTFQSRYGSPATGIQSIRVYSGVPVAPPQLSAMSPGASETISAPSGGFGSFAGGDQVLVLPYTTPTSSWTAGVAAGVSAWSNGQITFSAPPSVTAGSVVVETAYGDPNFWFPYTVSGEQAVAVTSVSPDSGATGGGAAVTIYGRGFVSPVSVTFGGTAASAVTLVSQDEVRALTPSGTGAVDTQVGDWMGSSPTSTGDLYSYRASYPPGALMELSPARICDTRLHNPSGLGGAAAQCNGDPLRAGRPLDVHVAGLGGVPSSGAGAAVLNVTVTEPSKRGYLTVYPAGQAVPTTSNLNFAAGETVSDLVQVGLGTGGDVAVVTNAASADVVVDVEGYVAPATSPGLGLYEPLTPARICDTRGSQPANQCSGETMGPDTARTIQVAGIAGVPRGAVAAALNVTVTNTSASGFLTVYPSGPTPVASNLNWTAGKTVANLDVVGLSSSGQITVYNDAGSAAVVVDLLGYYTAAGASGAQFNALSSPVRLCDTRRGQPGNQCTGKALGPDSQLAVQITGLAGIPSDATAVAISVTATDTTGDGFFDVFPAGAEPEASSVNWARGQTVPNLVIATLSPTGGITVANHAGSADLLVDVMGWYS